MSKKFIAVIEDDADDRQFISSALRENFPGLQFQVFENGSDFFTFMKTTSDLPGLVITDLRMPVITGFDVIRTLKENAETKDIGVVVISTSGNRDDIAKAKGLGALDYYTKPYSISEYTDIASKIFKKMNDGFFAFSSNFIGAGRHHIKSLFKLNLVQGPKPAITQ